METNLNFRFEHIYTQMNDNLENNDEKMNKKLLSENTTPPDPFFCNTLCNCLFNCCCFFLYV